MRFTSTCLPCLAIGLIAVLSRAASPVVHAQAVPAPAAERPRLVVQLGHSGPVNSVAFSPDGRLLLSAGGTSAILWDAATGRELRAFTGELREIVAAAFSPDGRYLVTGGQADTAKLWDLETGAALRTFAGHKDTIVAIAFSPDGRRLVTGSDDKTARLWDVATGRAMRTLNGHSDWVKGVAFSPDGRRVATGSWDKTARLWDADTGRLLRTFVGHTKAVKGVAFFPRGDRILTGCGDGTAATWDAETGRQLRSFSGHGLNVDGVAVSPDGQRVLTASNDRTAKLWDADSGREIRTLRGHSFWVGAVAFSADGRHALTGSYDRTARLWDVETGRELQTLGSFSDAVESVDFSSDGRQILVGSFHNSSALWDGETGRELRRIAGPAEPGVFSVALSPDSRFLLSGSPRGKSPELRDVESGQPIRTFVGHSDHIYKVAFSPDGRRVLSGSFDNTARLWDTETGTLLQTFAAHTSAVMDVAFSPDGRRVVTGSADKTAIVWNADTGQAIRKLADHGSDIGGVAWSSDGRTVLTGSIDGTARLWDPATGKTLRVFKAGETGVTRVRLSADGRRVLAAVGDHTARLWDAETGAALQTFRGHVAGVSSVAFSPDGRFVLTGGLDHTTRLWNADTGAELCALVSFTGGGWVVVDPQGRFDTSNLDKTPGLQWVMPDDPLRVLPLEVFMRDYYEPGLLRRILAGERFAAVRPLADLNRALPRVTLTSLKPDAGQPDLVDVTVTVTGGEHTIERDGRTLRKTTTGAYDVRLFRDGQIVAQWPAGADSRAARVADTLADWRQANRIAVDPATGAREITFTSIKLPRRAGVSAVEFTAYGFNEDRVKSATDRTTYGIPAAAGRARGRAYVISVGVNLSEQPGFDLRFAAKDARALNDVLYERISALDEYDAVVRVPLVSDYEVKDGVKVPGPTLATKANVKGVLALLAGRQAGAAGSAIPGATEIRPARPEDLVILSFSSHGYADATGRFYFLPYDVGREAAADPAGLLGRAISSDELTEWLRDVDARQIALIADACHAAATVESDGFKPGPMGSRGLGQLAYDKRMGILTATQAADVAWEYDSLEHGLLTYALVREGLAGAADYKPADGELRLAEWLAFAAERVPKIDLAIREGRFEAVPRRIAIDPAAPAVQRPVLFNFARPADDVTIGRPRFRSP